MTKPFKTTLDNGLRIVLVHLPESLTTTAMIAVEAGSEYETKEINGISHFLEHMCFKGTEKRPKSLDISSELDGLGANYNAFTSQEFTSYYAKARNENVYQILDILADMYLNPLFDSQEIEKERGVIIQELNMYEDTPKRRVSELFFNLVYGDQPAGWSIGGRKEVIKRLKREDFLKYRKKFYIPNATSIVIAGKEATPKIIPEIQKYFGKLKKQKKVLKPKTIEKQKKPQELIYFKKVNQAHMVLGFRAFNIFDKRKYALYLASDILGGGMSSRLFQIIRDEMGAAYYIYSDTDFYLDHGLFTVSSGVELDKIEKVIEAILKEVKRLTLEKVSKEELNRAKEHWIGNFVMSLESSDALAAYYVANEIIGLPLKTPEEIIKEIKKVKAEEINAVMKSIVKNERLNMALIGPFKNRSFLDILKVK
jgi:predicted Zn-dependent peptidase